MGKPKPGFTTVSALPMRRAPGMCASQQSKNDDKSETNNPSPTAAKPSLPARLPPQRSPSLESRPELVGVLPLWLLTKAAAQVRGLVRSVNADVSAIMRRRELRRIRLERAANANAKSERLVESEVLGNGNTLDVNADEPPSAQSALRSVAQQFDDEISALQAALEKAQESSREWEYAAREARREASRLQYRLSEEGMRHERLNTQGTMRELRAQLCIAQTRATAAERERDQLTDLVAQIRVQRDNARQDALKLVILGFLLAAILYAYVAQNSDIGPIFKYIFPRSP